MGKTVLLRQKSQQTNYYFRFAAKRATAYQDQDQGCKVCIVTSSLPHAKR